MNDRTINKHEYAAMRDKLSCAVVHACRQCRAPLMPFGQLNFDDPQRCPCRCERTRGMLKAIEGFDAPDA